MLNTTGCSATREGWRRENQVEGEVSPLRVGDTEIACLGVQVTGGDLRDAIDTARQAEKEQG